MKSYLLPNRFKFVGLSIFILAFIVPILLGMLQPQSWEQTAPRRLIAHTLMLIGLLLFILSREKIEDEFMDRCRLLAFRAAFIAGILYFLLDATGTFRGNLVNSSFGLLVMEIGVYMLTFYMSKSGVFHGQ